MFQDFNQKVIGILTESFAHGCQNSTQSVSKIFLMIIVFDKINSMSFLYFDNKPIGFLMKNFAQFRPITLLDPRTNCLRLEFFDHFVFCIFSNFELKCLDFAPEIKKSLSTLLSNCLEEQFDYHFFQGSIIFLFNVGLWPKFRVTIHIDFSLVLIKLHVALIDKNFNEWNSFSMKYTFANVLRFWSTIFQNVCEKFWAKKSELLSTCREDSVGQFVFEKFLYFNFLPTFSGNSFDCSKKLWLSKLQFTCPDEKKHSNCFPLKTFFYTCFNITIRMSSELRREFLGRVVRIAI